MLQQRALQQMACKRGYPVVLRCPHRSSLPQLCRDSSCCRVWALLRFKERLVKVLMDINIAKDVKGGVSSQNVVSYLRPSCLQVQALPSSVRAQHASGPLRHLLQTAQRSLKGAHAAHSQPRLCLHRCTTCRMTRQNAWSCPCSGVLIPCTCWPFS